MVKEKKAILNIRVKTKLFGHLQIKVKTLNHDVSNCFRNCRNLIKLPFIGWTMNRGNKFKDRKHDFYQPVLLARFTLNMLFAHISTRKLII